MKSIKLTKGYLIVKASQQTEDSITDDLSKPDPEPEISKGIFHDNKPIDPPKDPEQS